MMKLYGFGPTRSLRAIWPLQEPDVEFEFVPVSLPAGEHRRDDFLRINPAFRPMRQPLRACRPDEADHPRWAAAA